MSKDANSEGVPDLQEWLEENASIAEAIVWEDGENNLKYTEWDDARKEDLAGIFKKVWNSETLFQSDPLPNRADLKKDDEACQILDETDAWTMFASYTAHGLMMEIKGELDWSIKKYSALGLSELFDSIRMLYRNGGSEDYTVDDDFGYALPCEPKTAYKFLTKNKIIKSDRKSTIEAMLEWCRSNLSHSSGDIGDVDSYYDQWQYKGLPPVVKMIEGTKTLSDPSAEKRHYTAGCGGTSAFLKAVLRVVNIPVTTVTVGAGHKTPYFMEEGLYLSHGDDPYNLLMINDPPIPISELFLDEKKFEE
ncbi:MAG TPA: hypothetical protein PKK94_25195, partial [Leptospiraceae bacterium]|nr:hypothetical protein [Leptospiraceae bacterium]